MAPFVSIVKKYKVQFAQRKLCVYDTNTLDGASARKCAGTRTALGEGSGAGRRGAGLGQRADHEFRLCALCALEHGQETKAEGAVARGVY